MKKILGFVLMIMLLQACKDGSYGFDTYFCTTTPSTEKRYLYINKEIVGELPYTSEAPSPEKVPSGKTAIYKGLRSGKHLVQVKNSKGVIVFSEKLRLKRNKGASSVSSSISNPAWDTRVKVKDEILVIDIIHK